MPGKLRRSDSELGGGVSGSVYALSVHDGDLIAGGDFWIPETDIENIARFDGELETLEAVTFNNPAVSACDLFTGAPPDGTAASGAAAACWRDSRIR